MQYPSRQSADTNPLTQIHDSALEKTNAEHDQRTGEALFVAPNRRWIMGRIPKIAI